MFQWPNLDFHLIFFHAYLSFNNYRHKINGIAWEMYRYKDGKSSDSEVLDSCDTSQVSPINNSSMLYNISLYMMGGRINDRREGSCELATFLFASLGSHNERGN